MKKRTNLIALLVVFLHKGAQAQQAEMADTMRSEGKIYVVVAIMLVIFLGLATYLFRLDRKLSRIEELFGKIPKP